MRWIRLVAVGAMLCGTASAQTPVPEPVATARQALVQALGKAPLSLTVATFVKDRASGYGMYEARGSGTFKAGEPLYVYVEPLGYKYKQDGDVTTFGMTMDFAILSKDGNILGGKEKFLDASFRSHHENTEIMLNASINLQGAPPGEYQLELVVHDLSSAETARTRLSFTIE